MLCGKRCSTTSIDPSGTSLHRLRLLVHCGRARSLDLVLPAGMSLARVRRDGTDVAPIESGAGLSIPLPGASQGSKFCTINLDYVVSGEECARRRSNATVLPAVSFPCLSFTWDLVAPSGYEAVDCGPGLVAVDGERLERLARRRVLSCGIERGTSCEAAAIVASTTR